MQENINIPDSNITTNLSFRQLVLMNMQQLTNFPYIEKDFDALTDYELLCLVVKFLNDVIANQNEQNDSITRMYESFLALQTYVNNTKDSLEDAFNNLDNYVRNYFDNLDVQDEIDHKLDEYVADGTLEHIIASYLQTQKIYNTHDEMIADGDSFVNGLTVQTLGYHAINDGGGAFYKITNVESSTDYQEEIATNLYATLIIDNEIRVSTFGAVGDGITDDTDALQRAFDYAQNNKTIVFDRNKTYKVDSTRNFIARNGGSTIEKAYAGIVIKGYNLTIIGNDSTIKNTITQEQYDEDATNVGSVMIISANSQSLDDIGQANNYDFDVQMGQKISISNLTIDGGGENITRTYNTPSQDHLRQAKGISCAGQDLFYLEMINCKIIHTIYEGISGGGPNASIIIKGCYFEDCFPTGPNVSGRYELIEGCTIKNKVALELNPSYPLGTQIVRNNHFIVEQSGTSSRTMCGAVGLLSTTPSDNCNVYIEDNIFDLNLNLDYTKVGFAFRNLNNFILKNNKFNIIANGSFSSGYGGFITLGTMKSLIIEDNHFRFNYGTGLKTNNIIQFETNTTRDYEIYNNNINEIINVLDLSGTNIGSQANNLNFPNLINKYTFNVPAGSTNIIYRLNRMNKFRKVVITSDKYVDLTNFNIQGLQSTGGFKSLIGGPINTSLGIQGKEFNFEPIIVSSDENIWISVGTATAEELTLKMEFYS